MPNVGISFDADTKAVSKFESRRAKASSMSSAEWSRVEPALREKCFFSARVNDAEVVGKMRELIDKALDSSKRGGNEAFVSQEKFISEMKNYLRGRGYATGGTALTDITSRRRLGLIYQMNVEEAREYAKYVRGQDADALDMYPAQEFLRVESRRVPRTDWQTRWRAAGGKIYGGRMIALKSDPVWTNLSRFGRPYPPFDFGSGMGVEDIDRDEAIELKLLPDDEPADEIPDLDPAIEVEVSLDRIPEDLREQIIKETPNAEIKGDNLVMRDKAPLPTWKDKGLEDAKKWKNPNVKYAKPQSVDALKAESDKSRELLKNGETVATPIGDIKYGEHLYLDWKKYSDDIVNDRLSYYGLAKKMASLAREAWRQGNQITLINIYENTKGEIRGFVNTVEDGMVVKTFFVKDIKGLNNARKGELLWKQ